MAGAEQCEDYVAERLRTALARDPALHELGVHVAVTVAQGRAVLSGVVATNERRERVAEIARRVLPGFEIHNEVAVQQLAPAGSETVG